MFMFFIKFLASLCALALTFSPASSAQEEAPTVRVSQFSGEPVPRFASLRFSAVHGRQGPSLDHAILWRYEAEGMPVLVIRETHGWRRVRDKDGDEVWVQARMLSDTRTAMTTKETTLYRHADSESEGRALIKAGVILDIETCQSGWCNVKVGKRKGWIPETALWGTRLGTDGV